MKRVDASGHRGDGRRYIHLASLREFEDAGKARTATYAVKVFFHPPATDHHPSSERGTAAVFLDPETGAELDPSELLVLEPSFDAWSFGCMAFLLISHAELFPSDRDDNVAIPQTDLQRLGEWGDADIKALEGGIDDRAALDCIRRLLHPDPRRRMGVDEALQHPFLTGASMPEEEVAATAAIEWAVGFDGNKWTTTFDAIELNSVPPSRVLAFWYGSLAAVEQALRAGIPALELESLLALSLCLGRRP